MAYPIRFKLLHKETKETFKEWAKRTKSGGRMPEMMPYLNEQGNIGFVDFSSFYMGNVFLPVSDWELLVATEKDDKGQWVYKKVSNK